MISLEEEEDVSNAFTLKDIQDAMESQAKIGFDNFMVGLLVNEWVDILVWANTEHPHEMMEKVLAIL